MLLDRGFALGKQTRQEQRAFYLGARNRQSIVNSPQGAATDADWRRLFRTFGENVCAHLTKRRDHAVHGTSREPGVPDEAALKCLSGEQASEKPHRRPRISAINFLFGWCEDTLFSVDDQLVWRRLFDLNP